MERQLSSSEYEAYIPCYHEGNSVMAVKRDGGTVMMDKSIRSVIRGLLGEHNLDMRSLRRNLSGSAGRTNLMPIPLSLDRVLVPVKVRKTIGANDGCFAYIVLSSVEGIYNDQHAVLRLRSGFKVESMETLKTVRKRLHQGKTIGEKYKVSVLGEYKLREAAEAMSSELDRPATKGDFLLLALEIMEFKRAFEGRRSYEKEID